MLYQDLVEDVLTWINWSVVMSKRYITMLHMGMLHTKLQYRKGILDYCVWQCRALCIHMVRTSTTKLYFHIGKVCGKNSRYI